MNANATLSHPGVERIPGWSAAAGGAVWALGAAFLGPNPFEMGWGAALLLLAAMTVVPLVLDLVAQPRPGATPALAWRAAALAQPAGAAALAASFALAPGLAAGLLSLPWLAVTGLLALLGVERLRRRGFRPIEELAIDCGLIFVAVGGGWTALSRLGLRPLGFEDVIVFLTAIHFHYAGLVLPIAAGLAGRRTPSLASRLAAGGAIAGVPLVAAGITATQLGVGPLLECSASWITAAAAVLTAGLHLQLARRGAEPPLTRALWAAAGLSLAAAMALAAAYGTRAYVDLAALDIPWMRAVHGSLNALGFALGGLVAWRRAERRAARPASSAAREPAAASGQTAVPSPADP
jgi:hypothetical protein